MAMSSLAPASLAGAVVLPSTRGMGNSHLLSGRAESVRVQ